MKTEWLRSGPVKVAPELTQVGTVTTYPSRPRLEIRVQGNVHALHHPVLATPVPLLYGGAPSEGYLRA